MMMCMVGFGLVWLVELLVGLLKLLNWVVMM